LIGLQGLFKPSKFFHISQSIDIERILALVLRFTKTLTNKIEGFTMAGRREVNGLPWVGEDRLTPQAKKNLPDTCRIFQAKPISSTSHLSHQPHP
jgi:hypothetical protein